MLARREREAFFFSPVVLSLTGAQPITLWLFGRQHSRGKVWDFLLSIHSESDSLKNNAEKSLQYVSISS